MGRPPLEKKQRQIPVALPPEVRSYLETAAGDRSIAEEIRNRLDRTFKDDAIDLTTKELLKGIVNIAARLRADYGFEWHAAQRAHEAFVAAIGRRLAAYRPPDAGAAASDLLALGPDDPPETIGRLREDDDRRTNSYPQLNDRVQRRGSRMAKAIRRHTGKGEKS